MGSPESSFTCSDAACVSRPPCSLGAGQAASLQLKELSGLPILSNAFGDLQTEEEVASVAQDWTEKLGKALSARTSKAAGLATGADPWRWSSRSWR